MDPLRFTIAVAPLAVYLLLLGVINLFRSPFVTTGARDITALGIALCGFAVIGPMELFHPEAAASRFHGWVWLLLLIFYSLSVSLVILLMRPRLVIYSTTYDEFMPAFRNLVSNIDKDSRWAGESLFLPNMGIQLYVEAFTPLRTVQLIATGTRQSFEAWRELEKLLVEELKATKSVPSSYGYILIVFSVLLSFSAGIWMMSDGPGVIQALNEMLRQ